MAQPAWIGQLADIGVRFSREEAEEWTEYETFSEAWTDWDCADIMLGLIARAVPSGDAKDPARAKLVKVGVELARLVLPVWLAVDGDTRLSKAIDLAESDIEAASEMAFGVYVAVQRMKQLAPLSKLRAAEAIYAALLLPSIGTFNTTRRSRATLDAAGDIASKMLATGAAFVVEAVLRAGSNPGAEREALATECADIIREHYPEPPPLEKPPSIGVDDDGHLTCY